MNVLNPKVDEFIAKAKQWQEEYEQLRKIILDCGLTEDFKWDVPCYTLENKNIVLMHGFKEYCAILFPKGALLKDPAGILIQQTENTQAARQIRFTDADQVVEMEPALKVYIAEAIEVEKAGLEVALKAVSEFTVPEEFQKQLDADPTLEAAFEALTPGRQKGYLLYFSDAKQSKTRAARVEKYIPKILSGKGFHDR
ncbi:MAG: YdeI family protein [Anaerolineales bacterium]|nr:YdeI family protein [Anaerolineales bacterium]